MARVLAARANGELEERFFSWTMNAEKLKEAAQAKPNPNLNLEDIEAWLRVRLPALKGPSCGAPWVKYVLRELSCGKFSLLAG